MEKRHLLETRQLPKLDPRLQPNVDHEKLASVARLRFRRRLLRVFCYSLLLTFLVRLFWKAFSHKPSGDPHQSASSSPFDLQLDDMWQQHIQSESCESKAATENYRFEFNITDGDVGDDGWQLLDSFAGARNEVIRGRILLRRGDIFQRSDLDVHVAVQSNETRNIKKVHFQESRSNLSIGYSYGEDDGSCTEVTIIVFFQPWPKHILEYFEIRTGVFDIDIGQSLNWNIKNLVIHTSHGNLWMESREPYVDPLITHNVFISSIDGLTVGLFVLDGHLQMHNENGGIGAMLYPLFSKDHPFDPKSISISTTAGEIRAGFMFPAWPAKAYTHRTKIESIHGDIQAYIPHGAYTNISSVNGNVFTAIKTYGAADPNDTSEIYTASAGDTYVYVHDLPPELPGEYFNPLLHTVSKHEVGKGALWLSYPSSWWGEMEATIEQGRLEFNGSCLVDVEWKEGYMKAKRGKKGVSKMQAHVGSGSMTLKLGVTL